MDSRSRIDSGEAPDDGYTFVCLADRFGGRVQTEDHPLACGFRSAGWATKKAAAARGAEHLAEHDSKEAAPELADSAAERR